MTHTGGMGVHGGPLEVGTSDQVMKSSNQFEIELDFFFLRVLLHKSVLFKMINFLIVPKFKGQIHGKRCHILDHLEFYFLKRICSN